MINGEILLELEFFIIPDPPLRYSANSLNLIFY